MRRLFGIVKLGWLLPQNSFRILRTIRRAFPDQPLWAVENPILPGPAARARRMQRKVAAGAEVILTQPPFLWGRFTRWLAEVERLGVTVPIICGVPIITSPLSLRTWLFLVGFTGSHAETDALLERLRQAEARGEAAEEGMRYTDRAAAAAPRYPRRRRRAHDADLRLAAPGARPHSSGAGAGGPAGGRRASSHKQGMTIPTVFGSATKADLTGCVHLFCTNDTAMCHLEVGLHYLVRDTGAPLGSLSGRRLALRDCEVTTSAPLVITVSC